jgi:hypothetical protein
MSLMDKAERAKDEIDRNTLLEVKLAETQALLTERTRLLETLREEGKVRATEDARKADGLVYKVFFSCFLFSISFPFLTTTSNKAC